MLNVDGYRDYTLQMDKTQVFSMNSTAIYISGRLSSVSFILRTWQQNLRFLNGATSSAMESDQMELQQIH